MISYIIILSNLCSIMTAELTSQNYYLLDENNELIQASQLLINKSDVLIQHFLKNPSKAFRLEYPRDIIELMILKVSKEDYSQDTTADDNMINELYEYLNIHIPKKLEAEDLKSFKIELY